MTMWWFSYILHSYHGWRSPWDTRNSYVHCNILDLCAKLLDSKNMNFLIFLYLCLHLDQSQLKPNFPCYLVPKFWLKIFVSKIISEEWWQKQNHGRLLILSQYLVWTNIIFTLFLNQAVLINTEGTWSKKTCKCLSFGKCLR
jgi:hypothetical protein